MVQSWLDNTGLYRKYGPDKATPTIAGEYVTDGQLREIQLKLDLTTLTETETPVSDVVFFPKARVLDVVVTTHTVAATGAAIDLGLIRTDRTTEIDYNGFLAAFPTAQMATAGERTVLQQDTTIPTTMTGVGALIGTTTTLPGYITCSRTSATAFTAGVIYVSIHFYVA